MQLLRFQRPLTRDGLIRILRGESMPVEPLPNRIELKGLQGAIDDVPKDARGSSIDQALVEPLHRALADLPRSDASDMRMWHWLSATAFPNFVSRRWGFALPPDPELLGGFVTDAVASRFLGGSSLGGVSRNTFARLYWLGSAMEGDYETARWLLGRQDMFQAIFERLFGLYPPAVGACLERLRDCSEDEVRAATRWLNLVAGATLLEALSKDEIAEILGQALTTIRSGEALGPHTAPA